MHDRLNWPLLRVLVVDDQEEVRASVEMLLTAWGHTVAVASDGLTALDTALAFQPDIALVDLAMPGFDGFEVAREFRQMPGLEHVVLIAYTGYGDARTAVRAKEVGFDHHVVKSHDPRELERLLNSHVKRGNA
jgi:CheY-like chemotaxis protein